MVHGTNLDAEICVIGRCNFDTGIGSITYGLLELLSCSFATAVLPTEPQLREEDHIRLPNGRLVPVCKDPSRIRASFFCDVLWNGAHDFNYSLMPEGSLKYAYLVYDSDELPSRWVHLLNNHFDLILASSPEMVPVARRSQVENPIAVIPIPLDLDSMLAEGLYTPRHSKVRLGSVSAFHPRKGVRTLVDAFLEDYANRGDVELILHSNLAFGEVHDQVMAAVREANARNVIVTHGHLSAQEKNKLIKSFDIFVNCSRGEGYSIGPREALAYGKVLVLSDVGGHRDLASAPGVFMIPADVSYPARYPEIDNGVFGQQFAVRPAKVGQAIERALNFILSGQQEQTAYERRCFAAQFSFSHLTTAIAALVDPAIPSFRSLRPLPPLVSIPDDFRDKVIQRLGRHASKLAHSQRRVVGAHDGGFFSIFNAFMNHLAWDQYDDRCHGVLPDWDVDRLIARQGNTPVMSFCYGKPGDGNIWLKLFEPLYDYTDQEMNDPEALYAGSGPPTIGGDYRREPLMTYVHAYKLYKSREFQGWRRQYHRVLKQHVHLRPALKGEIEDFAATQMPWGFVIAAHVRHPSHTVEQPGAVIAHTDAYVRRIRAILRQRDIDPVSGDWGIFLATDQDRVIRQFQDEFGDRVAFFDDVRRTRAAEDAAFEALSAEEQNQEGHQLQHLVAADRSAWSIRMAWEVVRDAYVMAKCHVLLHVVSNVSTAVAYLNPELEMIFCSAEDQ